MIATDGVSRSLSLIIAGSSTNASFGTVSGVTFEVTQSGGWPWALVANQPAGSAGAVTPSKFSENPHGVVARSVIAAAAVVAIAIRANRPRTFLVASI